MHTEKDIWTACQRNSAEGQRLLYLSYAPVLKAICYRYIRDRDEANDILQDAFVKIFTKIKNFEGKGSLEGWLKRIMVNTALDYLQKKKGKVDVLDFNDDGGSIAEMESEDEENNIIAKIMQHGFNKDMLITMLHHLPSQYFTVFNMFFIDEISHKEIADFMGITEGNSRKLAFRAKEQVKNLLIKHLQENKINI